MDKLVIYISVFLLGLLLVTSGCRVIQPVVEFIFAPPAASNVPVETSPEGRLLEAVKGTNWLVALSILGISAGVFAFINGSKIGIPVVVSCCVSLFMSLAVARFAMWMAVFGMIGAVAAVAISIIVKNRGLREVVCGIQKVKDTAKEDNIDLVFQDRMKEVLSKQANSTKKLVSRIKAKFKEE